MESWKIEYDKCPRYPKTGDFHRHTQFHSARTNLELERASDDGRILLLYLFRF
jgi:hypothetical protein